MKHIKHACTAHSRPYREPARPFWIGANIPLEDFAPREGGVISMVARVSRPRQQPADQRCADPGAAVAAACQKVWRSVLEDLDGMQRALSRRDARSAAPAGEHSSHGRRGRRRGRTAATPAPLCSLSAAMAEHLRNTSRFPAEGRLGRGLTRHPCWDLADAALQRVEDAAPQQPLADAEDDDVNEREERILISEARLTNAMKLNRRLLH